MENLSENAVASLEAALAARPGTVEAYLEIADRADLAGAVGLGLRALQAARQCCPKDPEPRRRLAQRLYARKHYRLAALVAVSDRPGREPSVPLDLIAAASWRACGENQRALAAAERACASAEASPEARQLRARCRSALGLGGDPEPTVSSGRAGLPGPEVTLAGDLFDLPLPDLIEFLVLRSKTGVLRVLKPGGTPLSQVWLATGSVFGSWTPELRPVESSLGLHGALFAETPGSEKRFAWVADRLSGLAEAPAPRRARAQGLLEEHALRTIVTTLRADGGRVEFNAFADRAVPVAVDCRRALYDALRLIDEENRASG